ncbi:hypothetical protein HGRIS_000550 [Hohenbuehelia grisea]|uniref:Uncharacterized protein n=1 Tax=Hohenbuehelia grisea TaxID=104357 RepID=A0ABR3JRI7_9AGAR
MSRRSAPKYKAIDASPPAPISSPSSPVSPSKRAQKPSARAQAAADNVAANKNDDVDVDEDKVIAYSLEHPPETPSPSRKPKRAYARMTPGGRKPVKSLPKPRMKSAPVVDDSSDSDIVVVENPVTPVKGKPVTPVKVNPITPVKEKSVKIAGGADALIGPGRAAIVESADSPLTEFNDESEYAHNGCADSDDEFEMLKVDDDADDVFTDQDSVEAGNVDQQSEVAQHQANATGERVDYPSDKAMDAPRDTKATASVEADSDDDYADLAVVMPIQGDEGHEDHEDGLDEDIRERPFGIPIWEITKKSVAAQAAGDRAAAAARRAVNNICWKNTAIKGHWIDSALMADY